MGLTTQNYDILTRIAIGNGAIVYRGIQKDSLRQVAIKLLSSDGELDHRMDLAALFADVPKLRGIAGTHVCQLLEAMHDEDGPVLIYEFADGLNGSEFAQKEKLTPAQVLDVAAQLISALRSGERQRLPHGDLKPSNLVFVKLANDRPFTLVLDWGLAAYRSALHGDSLPYLAPERLTGAPPSHSADLFAAGAVLFYLCTGKVLATGSSEQELLAAWPYVNPNILAELRPDLPAKLVQWIASLVELDPVQRMSSAVEANVQLGHFSPPAPPIPPESIRPRPAPRSGIQPPAASGIAPAPVPVPRASAVVKAPQPVPRASAVQAAPRAIPTPRVVPPRRKKTALIVSLSLTLVALLAAPAWYFHPQRGPIEITLEPEKTIEETYLAIESFDYKPGTPLEALAGGSGWAGPWHGSDATVDGKRYGYPGHSGAGGNLLMPASTAKEGNWSRVVGPIARCKIDPAKGGHIYFGALLDCSAMGKNAELLINPLDAENKINHFLIVCTEVNGKIRINLSTNNHDAKELDPKQPIFLLMRFDFGKPTPPTYEIRATLYVNQSLSQSTLDAKAALPPGIKKDVRLPEKLGLSIQKRPAPGEFRLDEIRYGYHHAEMLFKPPTPAVKAKDDGDGDNDRPGSG